MNDNRILIAHADITRLCVDVVVVPTSVDLRGKGGVSGAMTRAFPSYAKHYESLRQKLLPVGEADLFLLRGGAEKTGQPRAIVTACVTTGTALTADAAVEAVAAATRSAIHVAASASLGEGRIVVAMPMMLTGRGLHGAQTMRVLRAQLKETAHLLDKLSRKVDVLLVAYSAAQAHLCRAARRLERGGQKRASSVPEGLQAALRTRSCAILVGAGVSTAAGYPGWAALLDELEGHPGASLGQNPTPTELQERADVVGAAAIESGIRRIFGGKERSPTAAHYMIASLGGRVLLTTNYDGLLEDALDAQRVSHALVIDNDDFADMKVHERAVLKIHGDAREKPGDVVLKTADYNGFARSRAPFHITLAETFLTSTVLCIGYRLGDRNLHAISELVGSLLSTRQSAWVVNFDGDAAPPSDQMKGHRLEPVTLSKEDRTASTLRFLDEVQELVADDPLPLLDADADVPSHLSGVRDALMALQKQANGVVPASAEEARSLLQVEILLRSLGARSSQPEAAAKRLKVLAGALPEKSVERERIEQSAKAALFEAVPEPTNDMNDE